VVDIFAAIVGVHLADEERVVFLEFDEQRREIVFVDLFDRSDELELRNFVNDVDVIDSFASGPISLMDGIHPQVSGNPSGVGFASLADRRRDWPGMGVVFRDPPVEHGLPQIVDMGYRDVCDAPILVIPIACAHPLQELLHRRAVGTTVQFIGLGKQSYILLGVPLRELVPSAGRLPYEPGSAIPLDQSRHLCPRVTRHSFQVGSHDSLLPFSYQQVAESHQRFLHPRIAFLPSLPLELHSRCSLHYLPHLFNTAYRFVVHGQSHSPDSMTLDPLQAQPVLETTSSFRLILYCTRLHHSHLAALCYNRYRQFPLFFVWKERFS